MIGGSGFIGSYLAHYLKDTQKNIEFEIFDKNIESEYPYLTRQVDVRDIGRLRNSLRNNSIIINLAAEHKDNIQQKSLYYDVNVQGAKNVCKVASEKKIRTIIFTSSVAVYGFSEKTLDEDSPLLPYHDYGKSKLLAERVYSKWQLEDRKKRTLIIIRPTVVFGAKNRGNVYNLMNIISKGHFIMIGSGENLKSIAYVKNLVSFIIYSLRNKPGIHVFNYVDKPDFTMNSFVAFIRVNLKKQSKFIFRIPYFFGILTGYFFDFLALILRKNLAISSIRIKKFCANSSFNTSAFQSGFKPPFSIKSGLKDTIKYEFLKKNKSKKIFYGE